MLSRGSTKCLWLLVPTTFLLLHQTALGGFACINNPCVHGVCIDDLNTSYSCYCIDGYTGIQCQINWDECWSNPCQNGATCIDGIAAFNCSCPPGFVGDLCEEDYNECDSNPCLNNGTCIDDTNGYGCFCPPGYSGLHCEVDVAVCNATNETRCANGGVCEEGPGVTFSCRCQPGWGGFLCEAEIDECMAAPCQNGGVCVDLHADYACACLFGFAGKDCEEAILHCEDDPCENSALCLKEQGHPVCYCVPDYHGERCQYRYDECELGPGCKNGGTCLDGVANFTCTCPPDLTGNYCECLMVEENLDCTYTITTRPTTTGSATITTWRTSETPVTISEDFTMTQVPNISTTHFFENITTSFYSTTTDITILYTQTELLPPTTVFPNTTLADTTTTELVFTNPITTTEMITTTTGEPSTTTLWTTTTAPEISSTTTQMFHPTTTQFTTGSSTFDSTTTSTTEVSTESTYHSTLPIETTASPTITVTITPSITTFLTEEPSTSFETESIFPETESIFPETSSPYGELTTMGRENVTKPPSNCSKPGNACQNGGTCTLTSEGYKCVCPYHVEGELCENVLGITNAAFGGDSYLTHRLLDTSGTETEFTTKTLSPSGLIFYSNIDTTYMGLYLEKGYLKFIFSCGYQTMLLSELRNPVNDGFDINIKAKLEFSKDFKRCNATVTVNNTLTMSGNQIARVNQIIKPVSVLHLGGLPQEKIKEHLPALGFMGCITNLKVFGKKVDIFKEAEDGFKISECSSLACLSNPCGNGGTCVENDKDWHCHCKNGYVGKICENSICDNNPCLFGATCLTFTGSGYICLCPFGKHGHFCEYDMEITEPNFSSSVRGFSSYAAYPIPIGGISSNMELKFRFVPTTMDQISILMFIGQLGPHDAFSDHMAVSFVKGYIMLTWNLGSGPRRIFTANPLVKGKSSYLLRLGRLGRRAWLSVDNLGNITGRSPGNLAQLDVVPVLYLGGHNSPNFSILPHDLPLHTGFAGCIYDVEIKSGNLVIPLLSSRQVVGRALGQCGTTECHEQLCQNGGACLHHGGTFACLCQDGWFGPLCSSKYNPCDYGRNNCSSGSACVPLLMGYECDCPVEKTGKFCEKDEKLSDVSLSGKRSYISLKPDNFETAKFTIELQIRTLSDRGLVLFIGQRGTSFLSLSIQSGIMELRVLPVKRRTGANEVVSIRSNKLLAMGVWYTVRLGKYGNKLYLYVENVVNTGMLRNGDVLSISGEVIYLGGLPDMSQLPPTATATLPISFTGCIRQLTINFHHIPLTSDFITNGRNVADCDGTPCGGDACENGGTCWLDSNLNPYCSCVEPYIGEKCETLPSCKEKPCQNRGTCVDSVCTCVVGYTGAFCETGIIVHTPEFLGDSHLILKTNSGDKKRDLSGMALKSLQMNFTTAEQYGLILWSSKANNFIGIGIEKGYLKLGYALQNSNKTTVEIPPARPISDGLWHSLDISFNSSQIQVRLDRKLLNTRTVHEKAESSATISTDGVFYLGGLPPGDDLKEKTFGLFTRPFTGCIEAITFNKEQSVKDFSLYEGENVGVCTVT